MSDFFGLHSGKWWIKSTIQVADSSEGRKEPLCDASWKKKGKEGGREKEKEHKMKEEREKRSGGKK